MRAARPREADLLVALFERSVALRGPRPGWGASSFLHKEWLHFTVHRRELDLVINFSVCDEPGELSRARRRTGRVGCLVRQERWEGELQACTQDTLRARSGETTLRVGRSEASLRDGGYDVTVRLDDFPVEVDLRLEPSVVPAQILNFEIAGAPCMNWLVVPRLSASGSVRLRGREHRLEGALAYHDHNWGAFRWGSFTWEWGYALPARADNPWSLVFARVSDRARSSDLMKGLFVWKHSRQERVFAGDEITVQYNGFREPGPLKLPRGMSLMAEEAGSDVPAVCRIQARRGGDGLDAELRIVDVARILVPNEEDLGVTVINECSADVSVSGKIAGERVELHGRSVFEFLGG